MAAGGFPEDDQWFFDEAALITPGRCTGYRSEDKLDLWDLVRNAYCGNAWALTDNLFDYLTQEKEFAVTYYVGTQAATKRTANGEAKGEVVSPVLPWAVDWNVVGEKLEPRTEYMQVSMHTRAGDVVFYRQDHALDDGGRYNHAAFIVGWGPLTRQGEKPPDGSVVMPTRGPFQNIYYGQTPHIVDHSSGASGWGKRAINDTWTEVNMLAIIHIPDEIPDPPRQCGE